MGINNTAKNKLWISISIFVIALFIVLSVIACRQIIVFFENSNKNGKITSSINNNQFGSAATSTINNPDINNSEIEQKICTDCVRRRIDGVYVKKGKENIFPIAAIIENHIDARPQAGLAKADFVIEAEAEGGITRFLAIFADGARIDKIGPIRSARPYYVDWAEEFGGLFAHCGGSPDALAKIIKDKVLDFNQFYKGNYFWRGSDRSAPHNVYTSTDKLNKYLADKKRSEGAFLSWNFKDDNPLPAEEKGEDIKIKFKTPDFYVDWVYRKESNDYERYLAGNKHKDESGEKIKAKNVVIQYVKAYVVDDSMRLKMSHIGEGKAVVCLDGKCEEGNWKKKTNSVRTRFYDKDGKEFLFNAGTTWVEVVRPEREVEVNEQ